MICEPENQQCNSDNVTTAVYNEVEVPNYKYNYSEQILGGRIAKKSD
jgi:hypothetical protein